MAPVGVLWEHCQLQVNARNVVGISYMTNLVLTNYQLVV